MEDFSSGAVLGAIGVSFGGATLAIFNRAGLEFINSIAIGVVITLVIWAIGYRLMVRKIR